MQRLGSPWLTQGLLPRPQCCRNQIRTLAHQTPSQTERNQRHKRHGPSRTPRSKPAPLFELSDLVLDLDAEGNPKVRSYSDQDEKDLTEQWSRDPKTDALGDRIESFRKELARAEKLWKSPAGPLDSRRIAGRDLLSVALLGAQEGEASTKNGQEQLGDRDREAIKGSGLAERLSSNGIPQRILEDDIKTLNFMLHWLGRHGPTGHINPNERTKLASKLQSKSFSELQRVIPQLLSTDSGAKLLSLYSAEVASALTGAIDLQPKTQFRDGSAPLEALALVNNAAVGLRERGIATPVPLRELGLRLASSAFDLQAIANFLRPSWQASNLEEAVSHPNADTMREVLSAILHHMRQRRNSPLKEDGLSELFNILSAQIIPQGDAAPSIRALIANSGDFREAYKAYILLLGELGALRSLWHEWQDSTGFETPRIDQRQMLFASAVNRSIEELLSQQDQLADLDAFSLATGNYAEDRHFDAQLISITFRGSGPVMGSGAHTSRHTAPKEGPASSPEPPSRGTREFLGASAERFLVNKQLKDGLAVLRRELIRGGEAP